MIMRHLISRVRGNGLVWGWLLLALMVFNSGFLYLTDNKQAGIPYVREIYLLCLFLFVFFVGGNRKFLLQKDVFFLLVFILLWFFLSSSLAFFVHGQPFFYGVLEERRALHLLIVVPALYVLVAGNYSVGDLEKFIVIGFLCSAFVGVLYSVKVIEPRLSLDFQVGGTVFDEVSKIYEGFRSGRFRIGTLYLLFVYILAIVKWRCSGSLYNFWLFLAIFCAFYTWHIVQTRSLMAVMALVAIWVFRKDLVKQVYMLVVATLLVMVFLVIWEGVLFAQLEKLDDLVSDIFERTGPRTRDITLAIIWDALKEQPTGLGALSLQWNDGFRSIYNDNFYLSDVGFFGVLYRFGLFLPVVLFFYYFVFFKSLGAVWDGGEPIYVACKYVMVISILNFFLSNALAFDGGLYGLVFAIALHRKYRNRECYEKAVL